MKTKLVKALLEAVSKDLSRPVLCGIHVRQVGESIQYEATDGHVVVIIRGDTAIECGQELSDQYLLQVGSDYNHGDVLYPTFAMRKRCSLPHAVDKECKYPILDKVIPRSFTCPANRPVIRASIIHRLAKIQQLVTGASNYIHPQYWGTDISATLSLYSGTDIIVIGMPIRVRGNYTDGLNPPHDRLHRTADDKPLRPLDTVNPGDTDG